MLMALTTAFALSQAFRTVAAILATPLQAEFGLSPQALGLFAGAFHFAFGALQLMMGIGIDLQGVRRTVLMAFPLAIVGAAVSALAPNFAVLVAGQVLIGIGCAPAFLVCTVFIARQFPAERFAAVSGMTLGIGSLGMLLTGTPLAWLVQATSWRTGFWALGAGSALSWLLILRLVQEPPAPVASTERPSVLGALRSYGALFALPHTLGIVALAWVTYASFISLRGLWLGPLLIERHGFSLVQSGNVAIAVSVVGMFGPVLFGRFDPGASRRRWIVGFTLTVAAVFGMMAFDPGAALDVAGLIAVGVLSGYIVLQYADVKAAYPAAMTGRAMAVFTMAMFLGVAVMQWFTGAVASIASAHGADPFMSVLLTIAALLVSGAAAFVLLPKPTGTRASSTG
ncbi:MAG: MFS transporter [Variovorax sp.]|uniref:MFS transporter n=2 Tax=Variovorax guangxiensis TaxID=1775474 RepID=A0A502DXK4_9BURK|nr:MAG: MFS transporter [Variovorax sp.]TPG24890.1 MFS transporter [Variovorax ginsengisoli]TPG29142.1 MFS transporter [Variovorax guangxiensis]